MAVRIGPLYVFSGFGGSLMSCLCQDIRKETISVGASGALFGLLGAMLSDLITNWTIYTRKVDAFLMASWKRNFLCVEVSNEFVFDQYDLFDMSILQQSICRTYNGKLYVFKLMT